MGIFNKKEKRDLQITISEGIRVGRPLVTGRQNALLSCIPKGILVYMVVFGSLGGFLSAFNVECTYLLPGILLLIFALYFSGLFAFRKSRYKDIGYIVFFVIYVIGIYLFKAYVNSGFAAIVNMVRQRGEMYFDLNTGNEFAENIDNRYLTVTITLIFIGIFEVLLLNIFVSNYMSLKLAVFLAVPMYGIPLYFEVEPDLPFTLCMLGGLMGIWIFKNSGHFSGGSSRKRFEQEQKGKVPELTYTQDNHVYAGVLLAVFCCVLLVGVFTSFYTKHDFEKRRGINSYKAATEDGVSGFLMIGFRIFFPNYYQSGGMSGGYLGNISALRPTNETHLIVEFVPYDTNPVYLKAYTGVQYTGDRWLNGYTLTGTEFGNSPYFKVESMAEEAKQLAGLYKKQPQKYGKGIMKITNRAANPNYAYYPYFTKFDDYSKYTSNKDQIFLPGSINKIKEFTYYPNINYEAEIREAVSLVPGMETVSGTAAYTLLHPSNEAAVDRFIREAGVVQGDVDAAQKVVEHFHKEYSYSYSPGRVPRGDDFVNYFLEENKKGICSHFASAATLIFRRLGIPARYVEGYAFGYGQIMASEKSDLEEKWYRGHRLLKEETARIVEVKDSNAHAWVEIYQEGKGWMIVDPTPAVSDEGVGRNGGLLNSVRNFWENSPGFSIDGDLSGFNLGFLNSDGFRLAAVGVVVLALFLLFARAAAVRIYRFSRWHTQDLRGNLLWYYGEVCRKKSQRDKEFSRLSVPSEQIHYLMEKYDMGKKKTALPDTGRVVRLLEEICFAPGEPDREDYQYVMEVLKKMKRGTFKN